MKGMFQKKTEVGKRSRRIVGVDRNLDVKGQGPPVWGSALARAP